MRAASDATKAGCSGGAPSRTPTATASASAMRIASGRSAMQIALGDLARQQHAVAAAALGGVERAVGLLDERVEALAGAQRRRAAGDLDRELLAVDGDRPAVDRPLQLHRAPRELALVADLAEEHGELLAAPARDAVVRPDRVAQAAGDLDQHAVAGAVAERVVDLLEVVEVEEHEAALVAGLERERDVLAEREPVVRAGDDVGARLLLGLDAQLAELGVGAAQLVDARLQAPLELAPVADVEHEAEPHACARRRRRTARCGRAPSARRRRSR